jgi:murein DD-endopeptidase MepM/ murein hydrolase activator NlpD
LGRLGAAVGVKWWPLFLLVGCAETGGSQIREISTIHELTPSRARARAARKIANANPDLSPKTTSGGPCGMLWPVDGPLSSPFGRRDGQPHDGIDLAVGEGTPVRAACDGEVAYAGDKLRGYGRLVVLAHAGGFATVYAHNSLLEVQEGAHVTRGQEIARSGATGHVTAPHVHFEVRRDNHPEDPLQYLPPRESHIVEARRGDLNGSTHRAYRRTNP